MNKFSKLNTTHKDSERSNQNRHPAQILIKTPAGRILFQAITLGCLLKLIKYRGKNDWLFCCKYIYYSQATFPKKIKLRLSEISKWSDSSIKNIMQELLKQSNLGYTHAKLSSIASPVQYYKTARKTITSFEIFKNVPGLAERIVEFINFIIVLSQQDFSKILRPIDNKLMEIGWPPSMRLTPQETIGLTVSNPPLTKIQIEKYLLRKFSNEMFSEMIENWEEINLFAKRINILKDAISAHNVGKYTLSIPILLAQCEGIIVSMANLKGRKTHSDMINEINKLSKNAILYESFMNILTNSFLEKFKFGQNEFYGLGRNSILHGINLEYATPENSLRSILLIDFLFEISKSVQKNNEEDN